MRVPAGGSLCRGASEIVRVKRINRRNIREVARFVLHDLRMPGKVRRQPGEQIARQARLLPRVDGAVQSSPQLNGLVERYAPHRVRRIPLLRGTPECPKLFVGGRRRSNPARTVRRGLKKRAQIRERATAASTPAGLYQKRKRRFLDAIGIAPLYCRTTRRERIFDWNSSLSISFCNARKKLAEIIAQGRDPYPHKYDGTHHGAGMLASI